MSKALTAKCITCRKLRKKPLDQLMGQILSLRVATGFPPFSNTAIDMFGPLYSSSNNIWEGPPITPNDILMGHHLPLPQPKSEERVNPRHLLRSTQDGVNEFWKCWMRFFAPNLLPRNKWFRARENVEVDDLVLELDPNQKRS